MQTQTLLLIAGILLILIGLVHSWLGEKLVFRRLRHIGASPGDARSRLPDAHLRILWATWHGATVQSWASAAILIYASQEAVPELAINAVMLATAGFGLLVAVGTRGRHPGGIALLAVALIVWFAKT